MRILNNTFWENKAVHLAKIPECLMRKNQRINETWYVNTYSYILLSQSI